MRHVCQLTSLLWFLTTFNASLTGALGLSDNGTLITVDNIPYYASGEAVARLEAPFKHQRPWEVTTEYAPITVIRTLSCKFNSTELNDKITDFTSRDDVFQPGFLRALFLAYRGTDAFKPDLSDLATRFPDLRIESIMAGQSGIQGIAPAVLSMDLPSGPYFLSSHTGQIFRAYRLYQDDHLAFVQPTIGRGDGSHAALPATSADLMAKSVAVPSRLYYTITPEQPLAGLRFAVKDIFHVRGLHTSGGNRAYYYLYGERNETAPAVQRLLDQGAVLVGKTGTVQFANGDRVTADWVDIHCPFNPRGDGYQDPSGSSSGSGAAIGAYPWLDLAVGLDTGGSIRGPAGAQGIYGNRPSTGAISLEQVIPLSPHLDTAGVFARTASLWSTTVHAWYQNFTDDFPAYPKNIYYSSESAGYGSDGSSTNEALELVEGFVRSLESFLGSNRTIANIEDRWAASRPSQVSSNVSELLYSTYGVLTAVDQYRLLGQPLFDDYAAKHDGRLPFINPGPLVRWQWGQNHSEEYDAAVHNMTTFSTWWSTSGYGRRSSSTCSEGIYVYPWSLGSPSYRNTYFDAPTQPPLGFADWALAGYVGGAELVVPIGEVAYNSTISLQREYLPVSVSLLVARGCDLVLANLARDLEAEGILKPSRTGARI